MTEPLWQHALQFLEKHLEDAQSYPPEHIYMFADNTGILERHRQLLAKPLHNNEVDMKIMYCELIKMLIAYERGVNPEKYDTNSSVTKMEGSQELMNRLQSYLNQRFLTDVDQLKRHQKITEKQRGNININETNADSTTAMNKRLKQMEEKYETLLQEHLSMKTSLCNVADYNHSLSNKLILLEEKTNRNVNDTRSLVGKESYTIEDIGNNLLGQKVFENIQQNFNKKIEDHIFTQSNILKSIKQRVDKHDDELSLLVEHNFVQDARLLHIENLKEKESDFPHKGDNTQHLSSALENILDINKENKLLIERLNAEEKRFKDFEKTKLDAMEKSMNFCKEKCDIEILNDEMNKKTSMINNIVDKQNLIHIQLMQLKDKFESCWQSLEERIKEIQCTDKSQRKESKEIRYEKVIANKSVNLKLPNNGQNLEKRLDSLEYKVEELKSNNHGKQADYAKCTDKNIFENIGHRTTNLTKSIDCETQQTTRNLHLTDLLSDTLKEKYKLADLAKVAGKSNSKTEDALEELSEKVKANSMEIINLKLLSDNIEQTQKKHQEISNDSTVRMTNLTMITSNIKKELENIEIQVTDNTRKYGDLIKRLEKVTHREITDDLEQKGIKKSLKTILQKVDENVRSIESNKCRIEESKVRINQLQILPQEQSGDKDAKQNIIGNKDVSTTECGNIWANSNIEENIRNIINTIVKDYLKTLTLTNQPSERTPKEEFEAFFKDVQHRNITCDRQELKIKDIEQRLMNLIESYDKEMKTNKNKPTPEGEFTKIIEQANILMVNDAQAKLRIASIETIQKDLIDKFSNLESADAYLQEANRMLTEKIMKFTELFKEQDPRNFNDLIKSLNEKVQNIESSFMAVLTDMKDVQRTNSKKLMELQSPSNVEVLEIHDKQLKDVQFLLTHQESQLQNRLSSLQLLIENLDKKIQMMESQKLNTSDFTIFKDTNREGLLNCKNNLTNIDIKNESLNEALVKIREKIQAFEERVSKETHGSKFIKIEDFDILAKTLSDKYKTLEMYLKDNKNATGTSSAEEATELWKLILDILAVFRASTLVLISSGAVAEVLADALGVYRLTGTHNNHPLYKQDGGENYIFYYANWWIVGTVVGMPHGWLRTNFTGHWLPDNNNGWQYRTPWQDGWMEDDQTLRIEALTDIEKIHQKIRQMERCQE